MGMCMCTYFNMHSAQLRAGYYEMHTQFKKAVCATIHMFHTWNGHIWARVTAAAAATLPYLIIVRIHQEPYTLNTNATLKKKMKIYLLSNFFFWDLMQLRIHLSMARRRPQQTQLVPICGRSMCGTCGASHILLV